MRAHFEACARLTDAGVDAVCALCPGLRALAVRAASVRAVA